MEALLCVVCSAARLALAMIAEAERALLEAQIATMPAAAETAIEKDQAVDTTAHRDEWLSSPGLQQPGSFWHLRPWKCSGQRHCS
ncbi:hypothetical protein JQ597_26295 [Bradyrhizobium sp. AUGA SZCCT0177]|uniref:hypothetical protein n=1 Tax=unclassified Bradyrhizobium TaxID=2631580 RepID=UPI001BAE0033|nr:MULTISPECIES: hypothetical protein [unclassified Bradyrhizobium]MBR1231877.1 hypothetical protein [Bradyrhizobium sp. AUGA SZCCT0182]MBR1285566.1 hypothetical protein [Bradyrhizobium sp. AUGA SZCCT0177]